MDITDKYLGVWVTRLERAVGFRPRLAP